MSKSRVVSFMELTCTIRGKILLESYKGWIKKNDRVLDVGCGNGSIAKMIKQRFGCKIEGTDIMNFLKFDMPFKMMKRDDKLPYRNKSFDFVILNDVLHHTKKQVQILMESNRVGKEVLIFETKPSLISKTLDYILNWSHLYSGMPIPLTHKNLGDWLDFFKSSKFKVEHRTFPASLYPITHYSFRLKKS